MKKVVTLGEIMLRLSTPGNSRFVQSNQFDVVYGGGEANVAVSLSNYGLDTKFVTKLPCHEIGQSAVNALRAYGVDTTHIARGGERVGIYFLETGASMRASKVIYDRSHSSISEAKVEDFDFDAIFKDADWFHFTGITPALGKNGVAIVEEACKVAKKYGVMISVDLNYRKKLWTPEEAKVVMTDLMKYVDVCIGNEEDAEKTLGFKAEGSNIESGNLELEGYYSIFKQMQEKFNFKYVVTTLRESHTADDNGWSALIYDGKEYYHSRHYDIHIVDRVGGGDSFSAGIIYGLLMKSRMQEALEFAVAASALKHTIPGDFNLVSVTEVESLVKGNGSGRVER